MKRRLVPLAFSLLALAPLSRAQETAPEAPPVQNPARGREGFDPKQRWEHLSPEERARLRERFDRWKQLPPDQQAELLERHHALARMRDEAMRRLPPPEADRLRRMSPEERRRFLEERVLHLLPETREELRQQPGADDARGVPFRELRAAIRGYASDRLHQFEQDGVLHPGEAEHLLSVAPWRLADELRALRKREFLKSPSPEFQRLPPEERARLAELPPEAFLDAMKGHFQGDRRGGPHPPRDFFDRLRRGGRGPGGPGGPEGGRFQVPRQLLQHLTDEQRTQIEAARGKERGRLIGEALRENARAALLKRGEDPSQVDRLGDVEGFERDRRLLKLIDPNAELPPPPEMNGPPGPRGGDDRPKPPEQRWD